MLKRTFQLLYGDLNSADITHTVPYNKAIEIVEIGAYSAVGFNMVNVDIGGVSMLSFPICTGRGSVAPPPYVNANNYGLFERIQSKYPDVPRLIVGAGQTLTVRRTVSGGVAPCWVWYKEYEADDLPVSTSPGGSDNKNRLFISYGSGNYSIAAGATEIETVHIIRNPAGYPKFPFEEIVPPDKEYHLIGLGVRYDNSAAPNTTFNGLRIWKLDESILYKDETFCPNTVFPLPDYNTDKKLFLFEDPIIWTVNENCRIEYSFTNAAGAAELPNIDTVFIFNVKTLGA